MASKTSSREKSGKSTARGSRAASSRATAKTRVLAEPEPRENAFVRSWNALAFIVPWVMVGILGALFCRRALELLSLGDDAAQAMGLKLSLWKPLFLVLAVCPVAGVTPVAGPIAFIGLAVPHIVRLLRPQGAAWTILLNVAIGGFIFVTADVIARSIAAPRELPVSMVLALIGGPFFIHLVQRRNFMLGARA